MASPAPGGTKDLVSEVKKLEAEFLAFRQKQPGTRPRAQSAGAVVRGGEKTKAIGGKGM